MLVLMWEYLSSLFHAWADGLMGRWFTSRMFRIRKLSMEFTDISEFWNLLWRDLLTEGIH